MIKARNQNLSELSPAQLCCLNLCRVVVILLWTSGKWLSCPYLVYVDRVLCHTGLYVTLCSVCYKLGNFFPVYGTDCNMYFGI